MYGSQTVQQEVDPANVKINRTLVSLNVLEVFYLLQHLSIEVPFEALQRQQVNGELLTLCVNPEELCELGIPIPIIKARLLMNRIESFKIQGVPGNLVVPISQQPKPALTPAPAAPQVVYPRTYAEAFQMNKAYADFGNVDGQFNVALCYSQGQGVAVDKEKAFHYFKLAADRGHPEALCNVGFAYYHGLGVKKNRAEAFRYYKLSADQGYDGGMYNVAVCYSRGKGVEMSKIDAFINFELAAALGNHLALTHLGHCYDKGDGTVVDKAEAFRCYKEAADKGRIPMAQYCVANYLSTGEGEVLMNRELAFQYWKLAADEGNLLPAMQAVANCYARGDGVMQDKKEAKKYHRMAGGTMGWLWRRGL